MKVHSIPGISSFGKGRTKDKDKKPRYKKCQELKELEKQFFELKRLRYPSNQYLVADTFRDDTANNLTRSIIAYIRLKGGNAERISTTGRPIDRTQTFTDTLGHTRQIGSIEWIPGTGMNGSADIHCCVKGRAVYVEVKIGNDRQSQAQKNYEKQVVSSFGVYYIARTFETFVQWYEQMFKP